jgi:hypothetical protein
MFRLFTRLGVLGAVAAAALALSGTALANPTTPQLNPIPSTVFAGDLTVSWSPSVFDFNATAKWYELQVIDVVNGTNATFGFLGTSGTIHLSAGHTYGLRLRAAEVHDNQIKKSGSSVDVVSVIPFIKLPQYYDVYYRIPWPDPCLTCPPYEIRFIGDDPIVQRTRELVASARVVDTEQLVGLYVDARGEVSAIYG